MAAPHLHAPRRLQTTSQVPALSQAVIEILAADGIVGRVALGVEEVAESVADRRRHAA